MTPSRRGILLGAVGGGLAAPAASAEPWFDDAWHQSVLESYFAFGDKASGGPGDNALGEWLRAWLAGAGYACDRQVFDAPCFDVSEATLSIEGQSVPVIPQAVVVPTAPQGLSAPLKLAFGAGPLDGAIALIILPPRRWSSSADPLIAAGLANVWARGAAAALLVTTGPTGDALALNAGDEPRAPARPIAVLAPRDAPAFLDAAADGRPGRLVLAGRAGRRPAFNLIARLSRGAGRVLVLSTPRSGWFGCAGERGPGVAAWLAAALWLARRRDLVDVELVATSGHEYENLGGSRYLEALAPAPARTQLWVHLGANLAARDWQEIGPRILPLAGPDSQRFLLASADIVGPFRRAFAGQPGLEAAYPASVGSSAGELTNILRAGYARAAGLFGAHRFHHSQKDDMRCVSGDLVRPVSEALRRALAEILENPAYA